MIYSQSLDAWVRGVAVWTWVPFTESLEDDGCGGKAGGGLKFRGISDRDSHPVPTVF